MTQEEILEALEDEREKMLDSIEGLTEEQFTLPGVIDDWSVKDLLYHLTMWEAELVKLLWQAAQGAVPTTVLTGSQPLDKINAGWHAQGAARPLNKVLDDFRAVRKQTSRRVVAFSDADLNDSGRYPWLNNQPLWSWIAESSFAHEAEHSEQVRAWRSKMSF